MNRKTIKDAAWRYFSKYIRLKECMESTGSFDYGKCCDCGQISNFNYLDAGHFVPGRSDSVLFVEDNVHIQCHSCNRSSKSKTSTKEGLSPGYYLYMVDRYGEKRVTELVQLKFRTGELSTPVLIEIRDKYKELVKEFDYRKWGN